MNIKKLKEGEWVTGILLPIVLGVVVFFLISWFGGKKPSAILWGLFSAYFLFGGFISVSKSKSGNFERINLYLGIIALAIGIVGLIFWPEIKIIGVPIIIIGAIIAFISLLGVLGKVLEKDYSYPNDVYLN